MIGVFGIPYIQEGETSFSRLSDEAQEAIVDAFFGEDVPNLSEPAREEIRVWATPTPNQ